MYDRELMIIRLNCELEKSFRDLLSLLPLSAVMATITGSTEWKRKGSVCLTHKWIAGQQNKQPFKSWVQLISPLYDLISCCHCYITRVQVIGSIVSLGGPFSSSGNGFQCLPPHHNHKCGQQGLLQNFQNIIINILSIHLWPENWTVWPKFQSWFILLAKLTEHNYDLHMNFMSKNKQTKKTPVLECSWPDVLRASIYSLQNAWIEDLYLESTEPCCQKSTIFNAL